MGREVDIYNRPIAFIPANKACCQLGEKMKGMLQELDEVLKQQWGDAAFAAGQNPTAAGGTRGAEMGMWGGGKEEREFAGLNQED